MQLPTTEAVHVVEPTSMESTVATSTIDTTSEKTTSQPSNQPAIRSTSPSKNIKDFILTLDKFSFNQVMSQFSDIPISYVKNTLGLLEAYGIITTVSKDEYTVTK